METISILGSGWLGLPLAHHFTEQGHVVKASTTSNNRIPDLKSIGAEPFIVDINSLNSDIKPFLQADILIVNIPSKNVDAFRRLIGEIEASNIEKVLFVSSTSVYQNVQKTIKESDSDLYSTSPLLEIEKLFTECGSGRTTILRFGGLIGYSRHPGRFFKPGRIVQNPDTLVNLIHRDDCVEIIGRIVEQQVWGELFNACTDTHPTKREFYTRARESLGMAPPEFGETSVGVGKLISNEKLKRMLDYEFIHPDLMKIEFERTT